MALSSSNSKFQILNSLQPLVVIAGQTASGKSALAILLAQKYDGEIICADSRTIYKGMDVGTAKPSKEDQELVPHWGLDLLRPDERFSAGQFKEYANNKIAEIQARGNLPILIGGSGLYIDSIVYDYVFSSPDAERDSQNPRHLKKTGLDLRPKKMLPNTLMLGLVVSKEFLQKRIEQRVDSMLEDGLLNEVEDLLEKWGQKAPGLLAPGYKDFTDYCLGKISLAEAKQACIRSHKLLAKRQMTWFKRNKDIQWIEGAEQAEQLIDEFLTKFVTIDL